MTIFISLLVVAANRTLVHFLVSHSTHLQIRPMREDDSIAEQVIVGSVHLEVIAAFDEAV